MTAANEISAPNQTRFAILIRLLLGALLGAAAGYGAVRFAVHMHIDVKSLRWSDVLALWLGVVYLAFGLFVFAVSLNRKRVARVLEGPATELLATTAEVRTFQMQGAVLALAGLLLLAPVIAGGALGTHAGMGVGAYAAILLLFALQTLLNIRLWLNCDEFLRGKIASVAAITFVVGQGALFLWASAERLSLVPALNSWGMLTLLMVLYFCISFVGTMRMRH